MVNYDYIIKERIIISLLFDFNKAEALIEGEIMATMINIPEIKRAIKEKLRE
jgi:hypothetical protein